jgi:hypothetical protein
MTGSGGGVVVGVDDTPASLSALRAAADEAALRQVSLRVVHVWHSPASWGVPLAWPAGANPGQLVLERLNIEVKAMLDERSGDGRPLDRAHDHSVPAALQPDPPPDPTRRPVQHWRHARPCPAAVDHRPIRTPNPSPHSNDWQLRIFTRTTCPGITSPGDDHGTLASDRGSAGPIDWDRSVPT